MSAEEISIEDEIAALMNNPQEDPAAAVVPSIPESNESGDPAQRDELSMLYGARKEELSQ